MIGVTQLNIEVPPRHVGRIADSMKEWEGCISDELDLDECDVAAIKTQHPGKLKLQS